MTRIDLHTQFFAVEDEQYYLEQLRLLRSPDCWGRARCCEAADKVFLLQRRNRDLVRQLTELERDWKPEEFR